jgi:S-sulfo-L-cysteine synthase (O-acetyl-L-serine-dependent)
MSRIGETSAAGRADVLVAIGGTPLMRLHDLGGVEVHAKAEQLNPGGSVKDRAGRSMILDAVRSGRLTPGKTILDATSGNTGIALAIIGAALGYPVSVCLPSNASAARKRTLSVYGATIIETDPLQATDGAQRRAKALADESPDKYFYIDQYNNDANWRAHYETTAPEIWEQTAGRITHFIAGLGTSGTFVGTTRRLKELNPAIRAVSMQPDLPLHGLEGMKHMATALVPGIYDRTLADEEVEVDTTDAQEMTRQLARRHGLLVGVSAGANVFAAYRLARGLPEGSVVVTILCDSGGRYLADPFWEDGAP